VCDLETSRMVAPYIYDISHLRVKVLSDVMSLFVLFLSVNLSQNCYLAVTLSALCCVNASNNSCYWIFFAVHIFHRFPNLHYVGFFQLHRSTLPVSWEQIIYLQLPFDDVVHRWLAVSMFFYPIFAVIVRAS